MLDTGSLADWFSAGGSIIGGLGATAALFFAFYSLRTSRRSNEQQAAQLARIEEEQKWSQAKLISSWVAEDASGERHLVLRNSSPQPIYGVIILCGFYDCEIASRPAHTIHHARWPVRKKRSIPSGDHLIELPDHHNIPNAQVVDVSEYMTALIFMDAGGNRWGRNSYGRVFVDDVTRYYNVPDSGVGWLSESDHPQLAQLDDR